MASPANRNYAIYTGTRPKYQASGGYAGTSSFMPLSYSAMLLFLPANLNAIFTVILTCNKLDGICSYVNKAVLNDLYRVP